MSTGFYDKGRQGFAGEAGPTQINWIVDSIKAVLVDTGVYAPNLATDANLSDIPVGARVATSGNLTTKTDTDGVLDADDVTFASVTGASCEALVLYKDTGVAATSRLIAYIDNLLGLPYTPSGANVIVSWSNGANKIAKL